MASVWHLFADTKNLLGEFSSREAAEAVIHSSLLGSDTYQIVERPLDAIPAGVKYGPVYRVWMDLETRETDDHWDRPFACLRAETPDQADVYVYRESAHVVADSVISHESALATANRLRDEYLASGKPTRAPVQ